QQVERLKQKQIAYFKRLITGDYDQDYVENRYQVGIKHQQIGLGPEWYIGSYQFYLSWLIEQLKHDGDAGECYDSLLAVFKVILFDIELVIDAYFHKDHDMLRMMAQVFESNVEGVLITDREGRVVHANRKVSTLIGFDNKQLLQQPVARLLPETEWSAFANYWQQAVAEGAWQGETWMVTESGRKFPAWLNISSVTDQNQAITHCVVEFSDISPFHEAQKTLQQRTEELARSNRELELFAYVASHDLQEPLRMVASFTQLLARRYKGKLDADADEFIHFAVDGATRMQTLINDLLAYSRVGTRGKPFEQVALNAILQKAKDNLKIALDESHAEIVSDDLPEIFGDSVQLLQLFQNLISNAVKFRGSESPKVTITVQQHLGVWHLRFQDNGIGIAPEFFERIFVIFQRLHTKEDYPGTGIGLAIAKKIVERHGGDIRVESAPGAGAAFIVSFPVVDHEESDQ
ncbi:MAG: protoglobin domain-containing protein, partial [Methylococcales bacterium]|nr:protoglobin domain-containing protein [Methylococcales bacterium]